MIRAGKRALVLSPSATHPQDYGNRNRIFQTCTYLKEQGYEVHFLLYPYEQEWTSGGVPDSVSDIRKAWDSFNVIPPTRLLHAPPQGSHHRIDEWWDEQIGAHLKWLFASETFDIFVVNYTFFSKAFEFAPRNTLKILETHDIFSGRKELFEANGAAPEFFYTTPDQEKIALDRADVVMAIKDGEAAQFRTMTGKDVIAVPFNILERPITRRPERLDVHDVLRVGFIGALNSVNALNMQRFLDKFAWYENIYMPPAIEIRVAGNVCSRLFSDSDSVKLLGRIESVEEYYAGVDVVVAPMEFSTGMKIKVGEALSFGKPVVSTADGFDGFPALDEFHKLFGMDALCRALIKLAFDRERLALLEERSEMAAKLARRRSAAGYEGLTAAIEHHAKAVIFITDAALFDPQTLEQARIAQWAELCSYMHRLVLVYMGPGEPTPFVREDKNLQRTAMVLDAEGSAAKALALVAEIARSYRPVEIVVSVGGETGKELIDGLREGGHHDITIDTWALPQSHRDAPDLILNRRSEEIENPQIIRVDRQDTAVPAQPRTNLSPAALRYLPQRFSRWAGKRDRTGLMVVRCAPDAMDLMALELIEAAAESNEIDLALFEADNSLMAELSACDPPALLIAVGTDRHKAELCRSLADAAQVDFLYLSSAELPMVLTSADGEIALCASYADVVQRLPGLVDSGLHGTAVHGSNTGWGTYWSQVSAR